MLDSILSNIPYTLELQLLAYFTLGLAIMLLVPRLFERFNLPGLLGLILAGALLGPPGLGMVPHGNSLVEFSSEIGKLMLMFLIGLEINLDQFNKARLKAIVFGALTFTVPLIFSALLARYYGYSWTSSILIGSLLASHTLMAYPLLEKSGLGSSQPASVIVGATILTDMAALLTLAICASVHTSGFSQGQISIQVIELVIYVFLVVIGISFVARRLLVRYRHSDDATLIAVLLVMSVASIGAVLIHLEDIVGAFLAGLAVNSIARSSKTRENISIVGHALFIPAFFFSIGMQLSIRPLVEQLIKTPGIVIGLLIVLLAGKFLAAAIASWLYGYSRDEQGLMWSLTLPQVAATLAAAFVAFEVRNADGLRLIDEPIISGVLLLMLTTTIAGPLLTSRFARRLANARQAESISRSGSERKLGS